MVIVPIVVQVVTEIIEAVVTRGAAKTEVIEDIVRIETTEVQAKREVTEVKVRNRIIQLKTRKEVAEDIAQKGISEKWTGASEVIVRIKITGDIVEIEVINRIQACITRRID